MSRGVDCTNPSAVLDIYPCLRCESTIQMFTIMAGLFGKAQGLTDLDALVESAKRWRNMNDIELLRAMISVLPVDWFEDLDPAALDASFARWMGLGIQDMKAVFFILWCSFWESYSGSIPDTCENLSGDGPPNV